MAHVRFALSLIGLLVVGLFVGADLQAQTTGTTAGAAVSYRTVQIGGAPVGEVLVRDAVVLRLREPAGGFTVEQRTASVSARLTSLLDQGYTWQDVEVGTRNNQAVLLMGNNLLITVDRNHARYNNTTPMALANDWRNNMVAALRGTTGGPVVGGTEETWPDWTNAQTKIVPIISVGTPGVRLGLAQVSGPESRVDQVRSVVQIDAVFQRAARARIFVPSQTLTGLNRVQGVAVTALLQYELFKF